MYGIPRKGRCLAATGIMSQSKVLETRLAASGLTRRIDLAHLLVVCRSIHDSSLTACARSNAKRTKSLLSMDITFVDEQGERLPSKSSKDRDKAIVPRFKYDSHESSSHLIHHSSSS